MYSISRCKDFLLAMHVMNAVMVHQGGDVVRSLPRELFSTAMARHNALSWRCYETLLVSILRSACLGLA